MPTADPIAAILIQACPVLLRLGIATVDLAAALIEDAAVVTPEERAERLDRMLVRAEHKTRREAELNELQKHRAALRTAKQVAKLRAKIKRVESEQ